MLNLKPPYYAVIFSSQRTEGDHGYEEMADEMVKLASEQAGFLGVESSRDENGFGITISYCIMVCQLLLIHLNIRSIANL
ncbi:hypothetical protein PASE110613_05245 [Paenibacillus sediminis]|uniref:Uncharacterized protein n=1 Tax=Paenibacillus sediminis TaxID=664909 RepID=A0ABS4H0X8_9BACL|nr:hypothetical protein [Paenibacillus sediminis]